MNVERFSLSLSSPLSTAHGTIDAREGFVVGIEVDGTRGTGEATPLPGWTESLDDCADALERAQQASYDGGTRHSPNSTSRPRPATVSRSRSVTPAPAQRTSRCIVFSAGTTSNGSR